MIDYKTMKDDMKQKRIHDIRQNEIIQRTCFYCPNKKHELCPHKNNCLFDTEVSTILNKIDKLREDSFKADELTRRRNYVEIMKLNEKLRQTNTASGGY